MTLFPLKELFSRNKETPAETPESLQRTVRLRRAFILVQGMMPNLDDTDALRRPIVDTVYGEHRGTIDPINRRITHLIEVQNKLIQASYAYLSEQAHNTAHRLAEQKEIELTYNRFLDRRRSDLAQATEVMDDYNRKLRKSNLNNVLRPDKVKGDVMDILVEENGPLIRAVFDDIVLCNLSGELEPNWPVAERYTKAGFLVSYEKATGKLTLQFNESRHRVVYKLHPKYD